MKQVTRVFWKIFFIGFAVFALLILSINLGLFGKLPSLSELENPSILQATEVYAADGTLMGKYFLNRGNRSNVDYRDISKHAVNALIATEDERFYDHSGIDGRSVLRAIVFLGKEGGGSTITQQLALNMFAERSKNPIKRVVQKLKEWIIAIKLERNFTKEEILTLYLNTVPFGENVYGIRNAALTFFQKEPDRLAPEEAAVLIGLLKGNTLYNPRRNPKAAVNRRNVVLDQMAKNGYLTEEQGAKLKLKPIALNYRKQDETAGLAPYFREVLRDDIKKWCKETTNPATGDPYDIYKDGLRIYTTINPRMQIYAEEAVAKHMPTLQKAMNAQPSIKKGKVWEGHNNVLESAMKASDRWKNGREEGLTDTELRKIFKTKTPMKVFAWNSRRETDTIMTPMDSIKYHRQMLQTSFMVMDPVTGEVKAWVGGIDFKTYKFDHVNINTKRQVGSSIKPFLYCQALEEAGFTPETQVENVAQDFPGFGMVPAKGICKGNTVSMATALTYSYNCATAYIMKQIGPKRFVEFLHNINIKSKMDAYPSICLGAVDLSMYEMLYGYTMFANNGYSTQPTYITRIEDRNGNVLESFQTKMNQVISEAAAYTTTKMLGGPVEVGTAAGLRARLGAAEMAGKTGTTNDNADAWFIGFTPQLLGGTWVGCDDRFIRIENNLGYGGQASRPIWEYFFQKVYADKTLGIDKDARFAQPEQMKNEVMYDYMNIIDQTLPPGAEGEDQGNGAADQYLMEPENNDVPIESEIPKDEKEVLKEARDAEKKNEKKSTDQAEPPKKKGFLRKIFGGKKNKEQE